MITKDGQTLLIEVNDGFALGSYGIDPIEYAKLLSARWSEIVYLPFSFYPNIKEKV